MTAKSKKRGEKILRTVEPKNWFFEISKTDTPLIRVIWKKRNKLTITGIEH